MRSWLQQGKKFRLFHPQRGVSGENLLACWDECGIYAAEIIVPYLYYFIFTGNAFYSA